MKAGISVLLSSLLVLVLLQGCAGMPDSGTGISTWFGHTDPGWSKMSAYERGKHHLAVGDYGLAIDAFNEALARDPGYVPAINGLAIAYDKIGRADVARDFLEKALERDPRSAVTLNNLAYLDLSHGERATALAYLGQAKQAVARMPRSALASELDTVVANNGSADTAPAPAMITKVVQKSPQVRQASSNLWTLRVGAAEGVSLPAGPKRAAGPVREKAVGVGEGAAHAHIRVANGTGHADMAHRVGDYLTRHGLPVTSLVNAKTTGRARSLIFYSRGQHSAAAAMAELLPVSVKLVRLTNNYGAVELVLGNDLDAFDHSLHVRPVAG